MPVLHDTKIVILSSPLCNLDQYRDDMGELSILVPKNVPYQIVENADEISDLERVSSTFTTTFEMPINHAARIILGNVQYQITKGTTIYRAILTVGDMVMVDGFLTVNESAERLVSNTVSYSIQVIGTHQIWKEYFRTHCFQDLSLGTFVWTKANLESLMQNNQIYTGGDVIYPMFADFGKFHYEAYNETIGITIYDFRFVVYKAALIRAAFAAAGYCVVSKFLDSEYYRKQSIYALKPNFYASGIELGLEYLRVNALVERSTDIQLTNTGSVPPYGLTPSDNIYFDNIIINNSNYWNGANYIYENTSIRNIDGLHLRLNVDVCGYGNAFPIVCQFYVYFFDALNNLLFDFPTDAAFSVLPNQCVNYSQLIEFNQILRDNFVSLGTLNAGWHIEVRLVWLDNTATTTPVDFPTITAGSTIEYLFGGKHFYEDENIDIAFTLDCGKTLYDFVLDERKMYNLRFDTDQANKIVYIEPQPAKYVAYESYTQPEKVVQGFEGSVQDVNGVWDITSLIDTGQTIRKQFEAQTNYNEFVFKFKESSDNHPNYEPYKIEGNELWSKSLQLGNSNTSNKLEVVLNTIEPTLNDFVKRASFDTTLDYRAVNIPIMWDSAPDTDGTPPNAGVNYEFRTFHVFGMLIQLGVDPNGGANVSRRWKFENTTMIFTPTLAQALPPTLMYQTAFTPLFKVINNVFGDNVYNYYQKDLVTTFYPDTINENQNGIELNLEIRLTAMQFKCLNIRQLVRIFSEKLPLIHLNGYYTISRITMPFNDPKLAIITLIPKLPCS